VVLVEDDQVVQTFSAECSNDALRNRVRARRSNGRGDGIYTEPSGALAEVAAIDRIAVAQQMARLMSPGRRRDQAFAELGRVFRPAFLPD